MRRRRVALALVLAACGGGKSTAPAAPIEPGKPALAMVALAAVPDDDATRAAAHALTDELRGAIGAHYRLAAPGAELASCSGDVASCMADVAEPRAIAFVMSGKVEREGEGFSLELELLDVDKRTSQRATLVWVSSDPRSAARDALAKLGQPTE